jgi:hypothetical protein
MYWLQLHAVLGALADMAAAGYPSDMQQLAAAAQLTEPTARSIAAAISSQGQAGIGAVKQALDPHVGFGQIKVVAALIVLKDLWFAGKDEQQHAAAAEAVATEAPGQGQQQDAAASAQPAALTDASNLPLPATAAAAAGSAAAAACAGLTAAAAAQIMEQPIMEATAAAADGAAADLGNAGDGCSDDADDQPAWRTVKRARPAFNISNKTGKRRRPTIAPPAPAAAAGQQQQQEQQQQQPPPPQQQQQQQVHMVSPAPAAAGKPISTAAAAAAAGLTTPAGAALITQQTVLQLLWDGTATGKQLLRKLGVSGREQEQQLQQVLQELVEEGEQVLVTPEGSKVDVNDECVRFIAF